MLVFTLTMPKINSWNNHWSGERDLYCKIMKLPTDKETSLNGRSFYYDFKDGWGANVKVKKVKSAEAGKLRKKSKGFCSYDWMIDSIIEHNKILIEEDKDSK